MSANSDPQFLVPASVPKSQTDAVTAPSSMERPSASFVADSSNLLQFPKLSYDPPASSSVATTEFALDVLKNGVMIENVQLTTKPFYVFGRLPQPACDISLEHPSISRHHAVLQYVNSSDASVKETEGCLSTGWHIYDLSSTHGTYVNKRRVIARTYHSVKPGDFLRFGASTRQYILQALSSEIEDAESSKPEKLSTVSTDHEDTKDESKVKNSETTGVTAHEADEESSEKNSHKKKQKGQASEPKFCDWGFEEEPRGKGDLDAGDADATLLRELKYVSHYSNDPKKFLKRYFEHELGDEPNYEIVAAEGDRDHDEPAENRAISNQQQIRLQLPVFDELGRPVTIEVVRSGKRKEAIVECARQACEFLDRSGELDSLMSGTSRGANRRKRAADWAADDYYDSDEDLYTDRTGELERKRSVRMKRYGASQDEVDTFETLTAKLKELDTQIATLRSELAVSAAANEKVQLSSSEDLMRHVEAGNFSAISDKLKRSQKKARLLTLEQDRQRVTKLIRLVQPVSFALNTASTQADASRRPDTATTSCTDVIVIDALDNDQSARSDIRQVVPQFEKINAEKEVSNDNSRTISTSSEQNSIETKPNAPFQVDDNAVKTAIRATQSPSITQSPSVNSSQSTNTKVAVSKAVPPRTMPPPPPPNIRHMPSRDVEEEFEDDAEDLTALPAFREAPAPK